MGKKGNLSWRDAIIRVLDDSTLAMHYTDIADSIVERGHRQKVGATPANSVASTITTEINQLGDDSSFIRVKPGEYMLRKHYEDEGTLQAGITDGISPADEVQEEQTGVVQAFGMYWRRDLIAWSSRSKLLGQQSRGAKDVDFSDQIGVYLLHDRREIIYVGRSTDRPIGTRLFEHTYDRLNGRWDRFSWFGLLSVTEAGKLVPNIVSPDVGTLIATLEALLIEALEPPQNRRRGDDFRAIEYLQGEDPSVRRKQEEAAILRRLLDNRTL